MTIATAAKALMDKAGFNRQIDAVIIDSVASQFSSLIRDPGLAPVTHDWSYLLRCASLIAQSDDPACEDAALRIAQHCITTAPEEIYRDAACVVFDILTNKPSIDLAQQRNFVRADVESRLPFLLRTSWLRRGIEHLLPSEGEDEVFLNRYQKQLWQRIHSTQILSTTAPTSTGKSFLLYRWLIEFIRMHPRSFIVYVVPTRALIQQVENDLRQHCLEAKLPAVNVSSLPMASAIRDGSANVMVLTQERLHILLVALSATSCPDVLVVDEAHKFGDGPRGVLLQNVIDTLTVRSKDIQIVFASPLVANPEVLIRGRTAVGTIEAITSTHVTVNQNLLWVSQVPRKTQEWQVELCRGKTTTLLGQVTLPARPAPASKRLTLVAKALADPSGGNLVYADGAADAEKAAFQLHALSDPKDNSHGDPELSSLIDLVRKYIHRDYALVHTLERRVAFHYGNMPLLVRTEIERLFKENRIRYLVCTSTLIEGVNLPCKSIFVRGPHKGRGKPMNETDFWNLAGRAGRLGKEFQGNIVCVDPRRPDVWQTPPPTTRATYRITPAADTVFENMPTFIEYLKNGTPVKTSIENPEFDQLLTYLSTQFSGDTGLTNAPACKHLESAARNELEAAIGELQASLTLPIEIVNRNPGISPFAIQKLLTYFQERSGPVEELLPVFPESQDAVATYTSIFKRINKHVWPAFAPDSRAVSLAIMVVEWMRGHALARIIGSRIAYLRRKQGEVTIAPVIRSVMEEVEQIARFTAPKYLSCYTDVLRFHLQQIDRKPLADELPDLNVWLEFGASQVTQLSMMGLGLSRTTAIALSEYIMQNDLSQEEVRDRLAALKVDAMGLPVAIVREVKRVVGEQQTEPQGEP